MNLMIKNMVCHRCKLMVEERLKATALTPLQVELGSVKIAEEKVSDEQRRKLSEELNNIGFQVLDDKRIRLIEQIKTLLIADIHHTEEPTKEKYSRFIAKCLNHDYSYLSNLFSEVEGITIEQFTINQRIERVKELLIYDERSLSQMHLIWGTAAHLSAQFKRLTGFTLSQFKQMRTHSRKKTGQGYSHPKTM